ncbi:sulfate adenylyltransferase subunit CysN [Buchnera aphidicola]|uniref:sulfate adenylyltransferase subunit CysN n=1 Tax=Buchnera aphidicola TaxID=9 RepID=UPI0031B8154F
MKKETDINNKNDFSKKKWFFCNKDKDIFRFLTCGSVDDGKSTLIGRLLYDTNQVYDDQLELLSKDSKKHGTQGNKLDFALLVDGLQSEREQGITIDVAYRYFSTKKRKFIMADTPGHKEYTCNMVTGASKCDLSIILVDAKKGLSEQTYRHFFINSIFGIKYLIIAINKMDLVNYEKNIFKKIKEEFSIFIKKLSIELNVFFIPISALLGINIVSNKFLIDWYKGPSLLDFLETIKRTKINNIEKNLRFPVQCVNRSNTNFRGYSGTIVEGSISVGQKIKIFPSNIFATVSKIVTYDDNLVQANAGQSVTVLLKENIDISRGDLFVDSSSSIFSKKNIFVKLISMSKDPIVAGKIYNVKTATKKVRAFVKNIVYKINIKSLKKNKSDQLILNEIGLIEIMVEEPVFFDSFRKNKIMGSMIFIDLLNNNTVAAGIFEGLKKEKENIKENFLNNNFELELRSLISKHFPHWGIKNIF